MRPKRGGWPLRVWKEWSGAFSVCDKGEDARQYARQGKGTSNGSLHLLWIEAVPYRWHFGTYAYWISDIWIARRAMGHGVRVFFRRLSKAAFVLAMLMSPIYAEDAATSLFKVITIKDEDCDRIVCGGTRSTWRTRCRGGRQVARRQGHLVCVAIRSAESA